MDLNDYKEIMEKCSYCSFCQATCPVYLEDLIETHVARSRLQIIKEALVENTIPVSKRVRDIVNRCLVCSNCRQTCPGDVPVDEIVIAARHRIYNGKRSNPLKRYVMKQVMDNRGESELLKHVEGVSGKLKINMDGVPHFSKVRFSELYEGNYPSGKETREKVAYFVGCATHTYYPDTGDAVMKVLANNGIDVIIPQGITCCGIPALTDGDIDTFQGLMKENVRILASLEVDAIVTDCTSCAMTLKEKMLKVIDTSDSLRPLAETLPFKIYEVTDYLNNIGLVGSQPELSENYTYHVPCHIHFSPTAMDAPPALLSNISGARYVALDSPTKCCGAGGTFCLDYKKLSKKIRSRKMADIQNTGAHTILTQCPSCRTYLSAGLGNDHQVIHPITFLSRAYGFDILPHS